MLGPAGENTKMISSLCLAAVNWAAKLRLGRSSQAEAWKALNTTISRKLMYPLPALTLTEKVCTSIMAPANRAALPKAGISVDRQTAPKGLSPKERYLISSPVLTNSNTIFTSLCQ